MTNGDTGIGQSQRTIGSSCQTATRKIASDAAQKRDDCGDRRARPTATREAQCVDSRASMRGVDQPVQRHRQRTRADHREGDPEQVVRRRNIADGQERADVGERQREDRVLELDEPGEPHGQRGERRSSRLHVLLLVRRRAAPAHARVPGSAPRSRHGSRRANRGGSRRAPGRRAGDAAREQAVRRLRDRVGAERLGDPRRLALEHGARRLGRDVARGETGAAGRQHDCGASRRARGSPPRSLALVGNHAALDVVAVRPRARSSRSPLPSSASPRETRSETVSTAAFTRLLGLLDAARLEDTISLVDRLRHVVDRQRRDRRRRQRLHLDAGLRGRLGRRGDLDRRPPTSSSTSTCVSGSGWQSGISSHVRFAAMIPASCAVVSASPFGRSRAARRLGRHAHPPRATARRRDSGLAPTSTICTAPDSSTWESSLIGHDAG